MSKKSLNMQAIVNKAILEHPDKKELLTQAAEFFITHQITTPNVKPDAIFAFSFGQGRHSPGRTNAAIAGHILDYNQNNLPILAQWEIDDALHHKADFRAEKIGDYLDTQSVLAQFKANCGEAIKHVMVFAHPDHYFRCQHLVKQAGFIPIPEPKLFSDWTSYGCDEQGYDTQSTQEWTQERLRFIEKEMMYSLPRV